MKIQLEIRGQVRDNPLSFILPPLMHTQTLSLDIQVTAVVSVLPSSHSRLTPAHFSCPHSPITVPPHSSHRLPLTFTPSLPSPHSLFALFEVRVQGGLSTTTVKCVGATKGGDTFVAIFESRAVLLRLTRYVHTVEPLSKDTPEMRTPLQ